MTIFKVLVGPFENVFRQLIASPKKGFPGRVHQENIPSNTDVGRQTARSVTYSSRLQ